MLDAVIITSVNEFVNYMHKPYDSLCKAGFDFDDVDVIIITNKKAVSLERDDGFEILRTQMPEGDVLYDFMNKYVMINIYEQDGRYCYFCYHA